jgi:hypothetical protein
VEEAGGAGGGWAATEGLPGVEADVMVVAAGREEGGGVAEAGGDVEAEDAVVEVQGALEVGDLEVDVAYVDAWGDGWNGHVVLIGAGVAWSQIVLADGRPARAKVTS